MKKKKIISILISVLLLCLTSCSTGNVDSKIVGTWKSERMANSSYIFRSNGTFERTTAFNEHREGTYTAINGILTLNYGEEYQPQELSYQFNNDKSSIDYGDMKIGHDYFEKAK